MKYLLFFPLMLLSAANVNSQWGKKAVYDTIGMLSFKEGNKVTYSAGVFPDKRLKSEKHYKNLRTTGIITTGVGIGIEIVGMSMFYDSWHNHFFDSNNDNGPWGLAGMAGGSFAICGGLTMWVMGHRRIKKVQKLHLQQSGSNIALVYKF